ncbi:MAG TPA: phosphate signaling complex protein PhoU [Longimicrobiales bacterium]|nr:phosphate signaling complex protein PhoU [Longimicrobiales bacterium]
MTLRHFAEEMEHLKSLLVKMSGLAEDGVRLAVDALLERDEEKAKLIIEMDADIDELELQIDDAAIQLLALQQPMARDLRFVTAAAKISNDLERVGDHAVNISEALQYLLQAAPFPALPELEEMARIAADMLSQALDAFIRGDSSMALEVVFFDDRVDELHDNNFRILLTHMMEDPRKITAGMDLLLVSGNLERIADLATNIAEEVVFVVEGRTIKHHAAGASPSHKRNRAAG